MRNLDWLKKLGSISSSGSSSSFSSSSKSTIANDAEKFMEASRNGNLIPLYRCIFSDQLTPLLAYRCLVNEDDREAPSFLFESVEPGVMTSQVHAWSTSDYGNRSKRKQGYCNGP